MHGVPIVNLLFVSILHYLPDQGPSYWGYQNLKGQNIVFWYLQNIITMSKISFATTNNNNNTLNTVCKPFVWSSLERTISQPICKSSGNFHFNIPPLTPAPEYENSVKILNPKKMANLFLLKPLKDYLTMPMPSINNMEQIVLQQL